VPAPRFVERLNEQVGHELAAHNQYLACAIHYDALTMPQMAAFFYAQALEERSHALMMVRYLLDTGGRRRHLLDRGAGLVVRRRGRPG
jgi:ferritin